MASTPAEPRVGDGINVTLAMAKDFIYLAESSDWAPTIQAVWELTTANYSIWVGKKHRSVTMPQYDTSTGAFPVGLLSKVRTGLTRQGFNVTVGDHRGPAPSIVDRSVYAGWGLWAHQLEVTDAALTFGVGIIKAATGSGKSRVAAAITAATLTAKWLVIVHREGIRAQLESTLKHFLGADQVGAVASGRCELRRVTTATYASMETHPAALAWAAQVDGVIGDEVHVCPAATHSAVLARCKNAYWRIGLSATPLDRSDQRSCLAVSFFGDIIAEIPAARLIAAGILARPMVSFITFKHPLEGRRSYGKEFQTSYSHGVVQSILRNRMVAQLALRAPKPCIVFFKDRAQGVMLEKLLAKSEFSTMFVDGKVSQATRKTAATQVKQGRVDIIIASVVFNEGIDIPELQSAVNGACGKSIIQVLQRIGRVMRVTAAKKVVYVFDIADGGDRFLEDHGLERRRAMMKEGHDVRVVDSVDEAMGAWA